MQNSVPTNLRILRGNPSKRPLPENEPKPPSGSPRPKWLTPAAKKHWNTVAKQLEDAGVLSNMDTTALGLYCEAFATWHHANQQVAKFGPVVKAPSGFPVQSPFLAIANKASEKMMKWLTEFGMTPASRTRVRAMPKPPPLSKEGYAEFADD